jgi:hypothetical protein
MTSGEHFNNSPSNFGSQEAPLAIINAFLVVANNVVWGQGILDFSFTILDIKMCYKDRTILQQ